MTRLSQRGHSCRTLGERETGRGECPVGSGDAPPTLFYTHNCPFFFFFFCHVACGILVPQPGIEPAAPAVRVLSPNHWTAREVPHNCPL